MTVGMARFLSAKHQKRGHCRPQGGPLELHVIGMAEPAVCGLAGTLSNRSMCFP
jgi:hypothetical protein